jgi:hypothetical protein
VFQFTLPAKGVPTEIIPGLLGYGIGSGEPEKAGDCRICPAKSTVYEIASAWAAIKRSAKEKTIRSTNFLTPLPFDRCCPFLYPLIYRAELVMRERLQLKCIGGG